MKNDVFMCYNVYNYVNEMVKFMKHRIIALALSVIIMAVSLAVIGAKNANESVCNISDAEMDSYANAHTENDLVDNFVNDRVDSVSGMYDVIGDISQVGGDVIGNVAGDSGLGNIGGDIGGVGDLIGGAGDLIGDIIGGSGGTGSGSGAETYAPQNTTGGYITIVPAATEFYTVPDTTLVPSVSATDSANTGETVDFGATANPYTKPVGELKGGDTGDGVKWIQWIFIYTRYGLKDNGITGVFDEDTMAVVKKLQKENGMVVDGIVDDEVIDKIEYLYFQSIYSEPATFAPVSTTAKRVYNVEAPEEDNSILTIIILISAVWVLAIIFIIVLRIAKKKNKADKRTVIETNTSVEQERE